MKSINKYIQEKYLIDNNYAFCQPIDRYELRKILEERLAEDKNADLNDIDISLITDLGGNKDRSGLFYGLDPHNIKINQWDVSNVTNMKNMFNSCYNLNCDLSNWDVSNVTDMSFMFDNCRNFEGKGLENWKLTKIRCTTFMFNECRKFNCNLENWNLNATLVDADWMFDGCNSLINRPSWYKR